MVISDHVVHIQTRQLNVGRQKVVPFVEGITREPPAVYPQHLRGGRGRSSLVPFYEKASPCRAQPVLIGGRNRRIRTRSDVVVMRQRIQTDYVAMDGPHARAADWLMKE